MTRQEPVKRNVKLAALATAAILAAGLGTGLGLTLTGSSQSPQQACQADMSVLVQQDIASGAATPQLPATCRSLTEADQYKAALNVVCALPSAQLAQLTKADGTGSDLADVSLLCDVENGNS